MKVQITRRENKNSIELRFDGQVSENISSVLSTLGFKWSYERELFWTVFTEQKWQLAQSIKKTLESGQPIRRIDVRPSYPASKNHIDDKRFSHVLYELASGQTEEWIIFEPSKPLAVLMAEWFAIEEYGADSTTVFVYPRTHLKKARELFWEGRIMYDSNPGAKPSVPSGKEVPHATDGSRAKENEPGSTPEAEKDPEATPKPENSSKPRSRDPLANANGVYTPESAGERFEAIEVTFPTATDCQGTLFIVLGSDGLYRKGCRFKNWKKQPGGATDSPTINSSTFTTRSQAISAALQTLDRMAYGAGNDQARRYIKRFSQKRGLDFVPFDEAGSPRPSADIPDNNQTPPEPSFEPNPDKSPLDNFKDWARDRLTDQEGEGTSLDFEYFKKWFKEHYPDLSEEEVSKAWKEFQKTLKDGEFGDNPSEFTPDPDKMPLDNFTDWFKEQVTTDPERGRELDYQEFQKWFMKHYPDMADQEVEEAWREWNEAVANGEVELGEGTGVFEYDELKHNLNEQLTALENFIHWIKKVVAEGALKEQVDMGLFISWMLANYPKIEMDALLDSWVEWRQKLKDGEIELPLEVTADAAHKAIFRYLMIRMQYPGFRNREKLESQIRYRQPHLDQSRVEAKADHFMQVVEQAESYLAPFKKNGSWKVQLREIQIASRRVPGSERSFDFGEANFFDSWSEANQYAYDLFEAGFETAGYIIKWEDSQGLLGEFPLREYFSKESPNLSDEVFLDYASVALSASDKWKKAYKDAASELIGSYQFYDVLEGDSDQEEPPGVPVFVPEFEMDGVAYSGFLATVYYKQVKEKVQWWIDWPHLVPLRSGAEVTFSEAGAAFQTLDLTPPDRGWPRHIWTIQYGRGGTIQGSISLRDAWFDLMEQQFPAQLSEFRELAESSEDPEHTPHDPDLPNPSNGPSQSVVTTFENSWEVPYEHTTQAQHFLEPGETHQFRFESPVYTRDGQDFTSISIEVQIFLDEEGKVQWSLDLPGLDLIKSKDRLPITESPTLYPVEVLHLPAEHLPSYRWMLLYKPTELSFESIQIRDVWYNLLQQEPDTLAQFMVRDGQAQAQPQSPASEEPNEAALPSSDPSTTDDYLDRVIAHLHDMYSERKRATSGQIKKLAEELAVPNIGMMWEAVELSWLLWYKRIYHEKRPFNERLKRMVDFWNNVQPTYQYSDSSKETYMQYSTSCPIAAIVAEYTGMPYAQTVFEPSAGNGLLVMGANPQFTHVNEIDTTRLRSLAFQGFFRITHWNAAQPFPDEMNHKVEVMVTNPPFAKWEDPAAEKRLLVRRYFQGNEELAKYLRLEHLMAGLALYTLKDSGRAAIIIMGHITYDQEGYIDHYRPFFNWLYRYYHVEDVINLNSYKLYNKQGATARLMLILIRGRKRRPGGASPKQPEAPELAQIIDSFQGLWDRVQAANERYLHLLTHQLKTALAT